MSQRSEEGGPVSGPDAVILVSSDRAGVRYATMMLSRKDCQRALT